MELNKLKDKRLFDFTITVPEVIDKENERLPLSELDESLDAWLLHGSPITLEHSNKVIGKGLRWWKEKKNGKTFYNARGLINNDSVIADEAWSKILNKELKDVSISGASLNPVKLKDGSTELRGLDVLEVAVCREGMHPNADILDVNSFAKGKFFAKAKINVVKNLKPIEEKVDELIKAKYPWNQCIKDMRNEGYSQESAEKICGSIKYHKAVEFSKPFADYKDFSDCVKKNSDKENPEAYCASIMRAVEGNKGGNKMKKQDEVKPEEVKPEEKPEEKKPEEEEKQDSSVEDRLTALEAKLNDLEAKLSVVPEEEGIQKQDSIENADNGDEVKLPKAPAEETDVQGEAGDEVKDEVVLTEKKVKEIVKSMLKQGKTTSRPVNITKSVNPIQKFNALDIARGKKVNWSEFRKMQAEKEAEKFKMILGG